MPESSIEKKAKEVYNGEKTPFVVVKKVRDAILDGTFQPGDRLPEAELGQRFDVSRSPVREALLALEKEGTVIMTPYRGAIVKPLSAAEASEIAELRLTLISLAVKPAYPYLAPADFDLAEKIARRITRTNNAKEYFEDNRRFWSILFEKTHRPILYDVFRQLEDRATRYTPLLIELFPNPAARPRLRELFIELYREGKIAEAFRAFKKIYLAVARRVIEHLPTQAPAGSS
jgi:DNA-binding GntR family transcriptional regulator